MSSHIVSAADEFCARRTRRLFLHRAISETLEPRRLLAAPKVVEPPTPTMDENAFIYADRHFHFQNPAQHLLVDFDQSVTVNANALQLRNLTTGSDITGLSHGGSGASHTWTVTGTSNQGSTQNPINVNGTLPRGNYELGINDQSVTNADGQTLDGNTYVPDDNPDGESGDDYLSQFFVTPGDVNHDRVVDGTDFGTIDNYVQVPNTEGYANADFNYDGVVNLSDYAIIDAWAGTALPEMPNQANTLVAAAGQGFIDLMWTPPQTDANGNAIGIDGYKIYRSLNAGDTWTLRHTLADPAATTWRDEGLADGTKYTYRVRPYGPNGEAVTTNKYWTVTNLPGPLAQPIVSDITGNALTLTWNDNTTNESGFRIEVIGPGGTSTILAPAHAGEQQSSFRVTGLAPESTYSFRVQAYITGTQDSAWSPSVDATTLAIDSPDTPSLVAPTGLTAVLSGELTVELSWTNHAPASSTNVQILRSIDGQEFDVVDVKAGDATSSTFNDLEAEKTYYFAVRVVSGSTVSAKSNVVSITTQPLKAPSELVATAAGEGSYVHLTWADNSKSNTGGHLRRRVPGGDWIIVNPVLGSTTTEADDFPHTRGQKFIYQVSALLQTGSGTTFSDWSNEAEVTLPLLAPASLNAQAVLDDAVNLRWAMPDWQTESGSGFEIQMAEGEDGEFAPAGTIGANAVGFSVKDLSPETEYRFRVRATGTDPGATSEWSDEATATTGKTPEPGDPPPPPPDPLPGTVPLSGEGYYRITSPLQYSIGNTAFNQKGTLEARQNVWVWAESVTDAIKELVHGEVHVTWDDRDVHVNQTFVFDDPAYRISPGKISLNDDQRESNNDGDYDDASWVFAMEKWPYETDDNPDGEDNDQDPTDRPTVSISATDGTASEQTAEQIAEDGQDGMTFTVTRSGGDLSKALSVYFHPFYGTATPGGDYDAPGPFVTIAEGETTGELTLYAIDDDVLEQTEAAGAMIEANDNYKLGGTIKAEGEIRDNEYKVELTLDHNGDGEITPADKADDIGPATLFVNNDDDNNNGELDMRDTVAISSGDDDLVPMELVAENVADEITLSIAEGDDKVRVWSDRNRTPGTQLLGEGVTEQPIAVSQGNTTATVWVEGIDHTLSAAAVKFTLAAGPATSSQPATAEAFADVVRADLTTNVDSATGQPRVLVGQRVRATVHIQGPPDKVEWAVPGWIVTGKTFREYKEGINASGEATRKLIPTSFDDAATLEVEYAYSDAGSSTIFFESIVGGRPIHRRRTLEVLKPKFELVDLTLGSVKRASSGQPPQPVLKLEATPASPNGGFFLKGKVLVPDGFDQGRWQFTQMINLGRQRVKAGGAQESAEENGIWSLDTKFAYNGDWPTGTFSRSMDDSPETALLNGYTRVAVAEEYRTYVMFKPDGGEWVPLQMIRWSWVGQADYKVGPPVGDQPGVLDWYLMAGLPLKGDLQPVFDHPVWDNVVETGNIKFK